MPPPTLEEAVRDLLQSELGLPASDAARVASRMPELDRFRASAALRAFRRATSPFGIYFCAESFVAAKRHGKCALVKKLFVERLSSSEKIEMLASWAFTEQYAFGTARGPVLHVMYPDCASDAQWLVTNTGQPAFTPTFGCSTGAQSGCPCIDWLRAHPTAVDPAMEILVGHLCDMRNSVVHESWPAFMVAESVSGTTGAQSSSMLDCYPSDRPDPSQFRTYESGIPHDRFKAITQSAIRGHLLAAYP
jgi:hypothetical protein